jgi:DNA-directed RNA polymerase specialized sigma24 family protein
MNRLAAVDQRKARVVEMRFFGGMTNLEISEVAGVSIDTVKRDWTFAKLWLARELKGGLTA